MPIGEIIGEAVGRILLEFVFHTVGYYTGAVALWVLTLGRLRLSPPGTIGATNRGKSRWNDWSIWLYNPFQERSLKAEYVCVVGVLFWMAIGAGIYFAWKKGGAEESTRSSTRPNVMYSAPAAAVRSFDSR